MHPLPTLRALAPLIPIALLAGPAAGPLAFGAGARGDGSAPPPAAPAVRVVSRASRVAMPPDPAVPARLEVTLTEGTNVAAALSPDGRTVALDLLGRVWLLPVEGGEARALTDALGDARQPHWSPDGASVVFQAYWSGDYDLWVVDTVGGSPQPLTGGPFDDREPAWSPDGRRVAFSSDRDGSYDVWAVTVATGAVERLTDGPGEEYGPAWSPDGRRLAYVTGGEDAGVWVREPSGATSRIVAAGGGEVYAPAWSPDGGRVSYVRIGSGESALHVVDAAGGEAVTVSEAGADVFPFRASWTGDGRLLYTADGRLRFRRVGGGSPEDVPFRATVTLERPPYRKQLRDLEASGPSPVRGIVSPSVSPGGSRVAFSALGDLWVMPLGGEPRRLIDDAWIEADPMWSPDGGRLAYASDRGGEGTVDVWIRDLEAGTDRRLTTGGGSLPVWSPDGTRIAYQGGGGRGGELRVADVATGESRTVRAGLNTPGRATWSPDGRSLAVSAHRPYSSRFREGVNEALLIEVGRTAADEDGDERPDGDGGWTPQAAEHYLDFLPHASVGTRTTDGPVWSPDGRWMAYVSAGVLWAVPMGSGREAVGPPRRLNDEVSDDPTWTGDSEWIVYLTADRLRRVRLDDGRVEDVPVPLTWTRAPAPGRTVVHAGRLFDGESDALRRDVDVIVEGRRIVRVEPHDARLHAEARVLDASDGVVGPGFIEMHTHGSLGMGERLGRIWLSYGITSVRYPAADPYDMAEARESRAAGRRPGPRVFGTGGTIDGSRIYYAGSPSLSSSAQVALELERAARIPYDLVKTYVRLPDAVQRRVIVGAHRLGLPVTSHELYPAVAFGADGVEHVRGTSRRGYSPKVSELGRSYQDVTALLTASGMTLTPTVGIHGAYAVLAEDDPALFDDPRVRTFFPWAPEAARRGGDADARRRVVSDMASLARRVVDGGGTVIVGTDSPIIPQGLSYHAEIEALVRYGGMRTADALRAATSAAADALGYGSELGRVRPGMLADLVVLGSDPVADARATRDVRAVVADGRVWTLEELLRPPSASR